MKWEYESEPESNKKKKTLHLLLKSAHDAVNLMMTVTIASPSLLHLTPFSHSAVTFSSDSSHFISLRRISLQISNHCVL